MTMMITMMIQRIPAPRTTRCLLRWGYGNRVRARRTRNVSGRERPEILERAAEQVLAQVEQPRPERRAVRRRADPGRVGETFQRADEDGELEVCLRDADVARVDAGAVEDRLPLEQLGSPGGAVPRTSLRMVGFQLEQVPPERRLEPGQRRLGPVGRMPERRLPPPRRRGLRLAARPPLEQPAERERRRLARAELADEPPRGRVLGREFLEHVRPAGLVESKGHGASRISFTG